MSLSTIARYSEMPNIAEDLKEEELLKIGAQVVDEFKIDKQSRAEWEAQLELIMAIAKQTHETKNHPWPNASNVKFPLITNAAIQFAARNYPEIVKSDQIVKMNVLGDDPQGTFGKISQAIEAHMAHQLMIEDNTWDCEMDKLLHILPVVGTVFTKTYYDPICGKNCIDLCEPENIVVNDNIKTLDTARRVSHILYLHKNDIVSGVNKGIYSKDILEYIDKPELNIDEHTKHSVDIDPDMLHEFIEQHRWLDLDDDGYQEPYIVTVHRGSQKVIRICARWDYDKIITEGNTLIKIPDVQYFTAWHFLPSPDGHFHSRGFGSLLYPINQSVNTLINQLIDSGTLSNLQTGIVGRGVRIKGGAIRAKMGEMIVADATDGASLKDNIFMFPTKEPSQTLFQLLGMLVQTGEKLSSITDVLSGQQEAQNAPATSVLALEEQGLKVFTGIQKRIFRSLKADFKKLFRLNLLHGDFAEYNSIKISDLPIDKSIYQLAQRFDICPVFDPNMGTDIKRLMRAQALLQLVEQKLISGKGAMTVIRQYLTELRIPNSEIQSYLVPPPPPPPDPKLLEVQVQGNRDHVMAQLESGKLDLEKHKITIDGLVKEAESRRLDSQAQLDNVKAQADVQLQKAKMIIEALKTVNPENGVSLDTVKDIIGNLMK